MNKRMEKLLKAMNENKVSQILLTSPYHIKYFTGKMIEPGERFLGALITKEGKCDIFLNKLFSVEEVEGFNVHIYEDKNDPVNLICEFIEKNNILYVDNELKSRFLVKIIEKLKNIEIKLGNYLIDNLRVIKDSDEINLMRESSNINDLAMEDMIKLVPEMLPEKLLARAVEANLMKHGASGNSFTPLIAYGKNAAEPHHDSDKTPLKSGVNVLIDMGGVYKGYCSDMTRTVFFGDPGQKAKDIYNIVLEANLKAIEMVKPGMKFSEIDAAARDFITKKGYGDFFTHRTGHNIGIEVHEWPDVNENIDILLKPGMIFSIEPGIYLKNILGVRIEDLVLVTENGVEVLNKYDKDLLII
ncbi:M24 family metallopeptidase [Oceanotoga teriensis]|uniref:Xaa-Pro dipeptidase n=1 Tax=Oceanotoga teriensis TaxID=515440 RepID=A0AA45HI75_9BACT|nr:Xaa-Pro peptidase family protein [Oceanotoga teriensis]MDO7976398.1 Xaa-Pro peptidase family protein [Oceanotoga teriensis]PWJ89328.1 Xaa-Pro dipeptidase [Oceanotoga teriensis]